jgi:hypothetical protein
MFNFLAFKMRLIKGWEESSCASADSTSSDNFKGSVKNERAGAIKNERAGAIGWY